MGTDTQTGTTGSTSGTGTGSTSGTGSMSGQTGTGSTSGSSTSGSQDTMGSTSSSQTASNKNGKQKKITGCLESGGSSGQYVVRHGDKDVTIIPSSAVSSEIASHVGQKVKLYGTWEQGTETAMNGSGSGANSSSLPQSDQPSGGSANAAGGTGSSSMGNAGSTAGAGSGTEVGNTSGNPKGNSGKNAKDFRAERIEMVSAQCNGQQNK